MATLFTKNVEQMLDLCIYGTFMNDDHENIDSFSVATWLLGKSEFEVSPEDIVTIKSIGITFFDSNDKICAWKSEMRKNTGIQIKCDMSEVFTYPGYIRGPGWPITRATYDNPHMFTPPLKFKAKGWDIVLNELKSLYNPYYARLICEYSYKQK